MKNQVGMMLLLMGMSMPQVVAQEKAAAQLDSPKASMKTMLSHLKQGEIEQLSECFVEPQSENERNLLLYGMGDDMYLPALHNALVAKFGEEASPLGKTLLAFEQQLQLIDSMDETTEGINGRLAPRGLAQGGIAFVKVQNEWKIALQPGLMLRPVPPERMATARRSRAAYLDTIRDIASDKFARAEEAMQALEARRAAGQ